MESAESDETHEAATPDPAPLADGESEKEQTGGAKLLAALMIVVILMIALTTYLGIYAARTEMIDLPASPGVASVRVRCFAKDWQCTVWSPLSTVEGWMIGKRVQLISGSILDRPATQ